MILERAPLTSQQQSSAKVSPRVIGFFVENLSFTVRVSPWRRSCSERVTTGALIFISAKNDITNTPSLKTREGSAERAILCGGLLFAFVVIVVIAGAAGGLWVLLAAQDGDGLV